MEKLALYLKLETQNDNVESIPERLFVLAVKWEREKCAIWNRYQKV